jgi:hypothetical protein
VQLCLDDDSCKVVVARDSKTPTLDKNLLPGGKKPTDWVSGEQPDYHADDSELEAAVCPPDPFPLCQMSMTICNTTRRPATRSQSEEADTEVDNWMHTSTQAHKHTLNMCLTHHLTQCAITESRACSES